MRQQDSLAFRLGGTTTFYSEVLMDPVFFTVFTAAFGPGVTIGATGITTTSIAAALATTNLTGGAFVL